MKIAEPVTVLTDYILAAVYIFLGLRLLRLGRAEKQTSVEMSAAAFGGTSAAALFGGTNHGLGSTLGLWSAVTWKLTVYATGLASFFLIAAASFLALKGWPRRHVLILAAMKLAVYALWVSYHDEFRYVIYDYAPAMAGLLGLSLWSARLGSGRSAGWISAGILVSFLGAGIQSSGFSLHRYFNHNDLYHVIQTGAAWLLYRGFQQFRDRA